MKQIVLLLPLLMITPAVAYALTPYQSGWNHGITGDLGYLTLPKKGFAFHTEEFNRGFVDGYCSLPGNTGQYVGSDADEGTFNCADDATTTTEWYNRGYAEQMQKAVLIIL